MKPKVSTGYFTPQKKKQKNPIESSESDNTDPGYPDKLLNELLRCPEKKKQILKMLEEHREIIDEHRRQREHLNSPVAKVKEKTKHPESPTMLMTRRALEKMNGPSSSASSRAPSPSSEISTSPSSSSSTSFETALKGVIAYVEIVNRAGEDRSEGAKNVLRLMGAIVRDKLSRDVTHVVFKDGGYKTFQQAKSINAHLVSILWVDSCRRTCQRQNEKHFPAMRSCFENETLICSQFQKEYEDILKEEYKKSVQMGTPLPSTQSLINRRRTLMAPSWDSSGSSYHTAHSDKENHLSNSRFTISEIEQEPEKSDMELTCLPQTTIVNRRRTMCHSLISSDTTATKSSDLSTLSNITKPQNTIDKRRSSISETESFIFGRNSVKPQKVLEVRRNLSTEMSALAVSSENKTNTEMSPLSVSSEKLKKAKSDEVASSLMSSLHISNQTSESVMASLQVSTSNSGSSEQIRKTVGDGIKELTCYNVNTKRGARSAGVMASPQISTSNSSTSSIQIQPNVADTIKNLSWNYGNTNPGVCSAGSDDSEIMIPSPKISTRNRRKTLGVIMAGNSGSVIEDSLNENEQSLEQGKRLSRKSSICQATLPRSSRRRGTFSQLKPPEPNSGAPRRVRKLYNPEEIDNLMEEYNDEEERQEKRNLVKKRRSDEYIKDNFNPLSLLKPIQKPLPQTSTEEEVTPSPPKRSKRIRKPSQKVLDNSRDEQKNLLEEVLKNKAMGPPKTPRRKEEAKVPITPVNRRSTLDFMSVSQSTSKKNVQKKVDKWKMPTIVCTKLHKDEVQVFTQIVKKLGRFDVEDEVSNRTSHVVAGESKRTINMLRGIARGCWILRYEWVLKSIETGQWLPEEDYEVSDFSPAVQKCRLERQAFGSTYKMDVFATCPLIFVSLDTTPRCSDLRELIQTCGGRVVSTLKRAEVVVGRHVQGHVCVNEKWVMDCIVFNKLFKFNKYLIRDRKISLIV